MNTITIAPTAAASVIYDASTGVTYNYAPPAPWTAPRETSTAWHNNPRTKQAALGGLDAWHREGRLVAGAWQVPLDGGQLAGCAGSAMLAGVTRELRAVTGYDTGRAREVADATGLGYTLVTSIAMMFDYAADAIGGRQVYGGERLDNAYRLVRGLIDEIPVGAPLGLLENALAAIPGGAASIAAPNSNAADELRKAWHRIGVDKWTAEALSA